MIMMNDNIKNNMQMTRIKALNHFLPLLLFFVSITAKAQLTDVRHEVEFDILNQFTVMEDGAGDLQPGYYYNLFHKGYKKLQGNGFGNPMTAKKNLRWLAEEVFKKEPDKAKAMRDTLKHRRNVEAANIADREVDMSLMGEKARFRGNMSTFKDNINKIQLYGGQAADKKEWMDVYNAFSCGFDAISEAYMPPGQRSKEYVALNKSLLERNGALVRQLTAMNGIREGMQFKKRTEVRADNNHKINNKYLAGDSMYHWGSIVGMSTATGGLGGGYIGLVRK